MLCTCHKTLCNALLMDPRTDERGRVVKPLTGNSHNAFPSLFFYPRYHNKEQFVTEWF